MRFLLFAKFSSFFRNFSIKLTSNREKFTKSDEISPKRSAHFDGDKTQNLFVFAIASALWRVFTRDLHWSAQLSEIFPTVYHNTRLLLFPGKEPFCCPKP